MDRFLTNFDIDVAKARGISYRNLVKRFNGGWDKERAITEPIKNYPGLWNQYKEKCVVSRAAFYRRIRKGMAPEDAALTPNLMGKKII